MSVPIEAARAAADDVRGAGRAWRSSDRVLLLLGLLISLGLTVALSFEHPFDRGVVVTRGELGAEWPLKVSRGVLRCEHGREITFQVGGTTYTLNRDPKRSANSDISPVRSVGAFGALGDLTPLVRRGQALCD